MTRPRARAAPGAIFLTPAGKSGAYRGCMTLRLQSPRLRLRPPRPDDVEDLVRILSEPEVARWWPDFDRDKVREELLVPDPGLTVLVVEREGHVAGAIQFEQGDDPMYRHAGIDMFLGGRWQSVGLGPEAIRAVVEHLFDVLGHHRLVIDPAAENERAIRAYGKVGFRVVGTMQQYERAADGTWRDGVLMELLARDYDRAG